MHLAVVLLATCCSQAESQDQLTADTVLLKDYASCSLNCIYAMCRMQGVPVGFQATAELIGPTDAQGTHSLADLERVAKSAQLHCVALTLNASDWRELPTPAIVHLRHSARGELSHFVVVLRTEHDRIFVLDPPAAHFAMKPKSFETMWTGHALVFAEDEAGLKRITVRAQLGTFFRLISNTWLILTVTAIGAAVTVWVARNGRWVSRLFSHVASRSRYKTSGSAIFRFIFVCVAGTLLVSFATQRSEQAPSRPLLEFDTELVDLGNLDSGTHTTQLAVTNSGLEPLHLIKARTTCSCAAITFRPATLQPGQTQTFPVKLNVVRGAKTARFEFQSNDPRGERSTTIGWRGKGPVSLVPPALISHSVPASEQLRRTVDIVYPGGLAVEAPEIISVDTGSEFVKIALGSNVPQVRPVIGTYAAPEYVGIISLRASIDAPIQNRASQITTQAKIRLRNGDMVTSIRLPISVTFQPAEVNSAQGAILFTATHGRELVGQERIIPATIEHADVDDANMPPWLRCSTEVSDAGPIIRLRLISLPPSPVAHYAVRVSKKGDSSSVSWLRVFTFCPGVAKARQAEIR